jgi:hypothetical protein
MLPVACQVPPLDEGGTTVRSNITVVFPAELPATTEKNENETGVKTVGVPEITPVVGCITSPAGRAGTVP